VGLLTVHPGQHWQCWCRAVTVFDVSVCVCVQGKGREFMRPIDSEFEEVTDEDSDDAKQVQYANMNKSQISHSAQVSPCAAIRSTALKYRVEVPR